MQNNIKRIRQMRHMTLEDVSSRVGVSVGQVSKWEAGKVNIPSARMADLARLFRVKVADLFSDGDIIMGNDEYYRRFAHEEEGRLPPSTLTRPHAREADFLSTTEPIKIDFPIYGTALGGPMDIQGQTVEQTTLNRAEVVHYIRRPSILMQNKEAYGLYVAGSSMEPRYFDGELIIADPRGRVKGGEDVVVYLRSIEAFEEDDDRASAALVKRLIRRASTYIELEQYSPAMSFRVDMEHVVRVDRVVPLGEILGA